MYENPVETDVDLTAGILSVCLHIPNTRHVHLCPYVANIARHF